MKYDWLLMLHLAKSQTNIQMLIFLNNAQITLIHDHWSTKILEYWQTEKNFIAFKHPCDNSLLTVFMQLPLKLKHSVHMCNRKSCWGPHKCDTWSPYGGRHLSKHFDGLKTSINKTIYSRKACISICTLVELKNRGRWLNVSPSR